MGDIFALRELLGVIVRIEICALFITIVVIVIITIIIIIIIIIIITDSFMIGIIDIY